jgi:hypothetical protein
VQAFIVAAIMLTGAPSRSHAETGSVRLKITKVGFIVGVGGGSGVLHFKGKNYGWVSAALALVPLERRGQTWLGPPPIFGLQRTSRVPIPPSLLGLQWRAAQRQQHYEIERSGSAIAGTPGRI